MSLSLTHFIFSAGRFPLICRFFSAALYMVGKGRSAHIPKSRRATKAKRWRYETFLRIHRRRAWFPSPPSPEPPGIPTPPSFRRPHTACAVFLSCGSPVICCYPNSGALLGRGTPPSCPPSSWPCGARQRASHSAGAFGRYRHSRRGSAFRAAPWVLDSVAVLPAVLSWAFHRAKKARIVASFFLLFASK